MPLDDPSQHNCQRFADRYVEYELVLLVIDLILLRPQVYRHLLFNRIPYHDRGIDVGPYALGRTATPTAADRAVLGGERALNRNGSRRWPLASSSSMSVRAQQCTRPPLVLTTDGCAQCCPPCRRAGGVPGRLVQRLRHGVGGHHDRDAGLCVHSSW